MIELLTPLACGLLFLFLGYLIGVKHKVNLIHSYHYTRVKPEELNDYTELMGKGISTLGSGIICFAVINQMFNGYGWISLVLFFIAGFGMLIRAQLKYNGGIF